MAPLTVLNVAEKPSVAKGVSQILGGNYRTRNGLSVYNKIYEYECQMLGVHCKMMMTSVSGHMMEHEFPPAYKGWKSCSPAQLFNAPISRSVKKEMTNIEKTLVREAKKADWLVLWTDCDREGENIACEIRDICLGVNRRLRVLRARFSAVTRAELVKACNTLKNVDQHESDAVDARSELDLRVGAAFTRMQTLCLQPRFPELESQVVSYGPCQFPTLGFVIDQYYKVESFVSETFWKIDLQYTVQDNLNGESIAKFVWGRGRVFDKDVGEIYINLCRIARVAEITNITGKPKTRWRPLPLTTVELTKLVSRKLHIDSAECMRIAEKMYMEGYISYPRTETDKFPSSMDLPALVQQQTNHQQWGQFAANLIAQNAPPVMPRQGNRDDQSHPAIHPTKDGSQLQGNEKRIFELITRHFLACCSEDARGHETVATALMGGETFTTKGLIIEALNWLEVYPYEKWNAKTIPHFHVGERFTPSTLELTEGSTESPKLLTEAELITLMDANGIGTDATMHEHIANIIKRQYASKGDDRLFYPTSLGMALDEAYNRMGFELTKPHLRAEMEAALTEICRNRTTKDNITHEYSHKYKTIFESAYEQTELFVDAVSKFFQSEPEPAPQAGDQNAQLVDTTIGKCKYCGLEMMLKKTAQDKYMVGCMGYPTCKHALWFEKVAFSIVPLDTHCKRCSSASSVARLVRVEFLSGKMHPSTGPSYSGCIFCDHRLEDALQTRVVAGVTRCTNVITGSGREWDVCEIVTNGGRKSPGSLDVTGERGGGRGHSRISPNYGHSQRNSNTTSQTSHFRNNVDNYSVTYAFNNSETVHANIETRNGQTSDLSTRHQGSINSVQSSTNNASLEMFDDELDEDDIFNEAMDNISNTRFVQQQVVPQTNSRVINKSEFRSSDLAQEFSVVQHTVRCKCDNVCSVRTSTKDGPNQNKQFYCCSGPRDEQCDTFAWVDDILASAPYCDCNVPSVRNRTKSEGRAFFTCMTKVCKYFQWIDRDPSSTNDNVNIRDVSRTNKTYQSNNNYLSGNAAREQYNSDRSHSSTNNIHGRNTVGGTSTSCGCGNVAVERTVVKEGPNKGRQFNACGKGPGQGCGYFEWKNEVRPSETGAYNDKGGGRGGNCFNCNQPGHWSSNCPSNGGFGRESVAVSRASGGGRKGAYEAQPKTYTKRLCSVCRRPGHNKNKCPRV
eukprot:CFRG3790T1